MQQGRTGLPSCAAIHDISVLLGEESVDFPGDPPFIRERVSQIGENGVCDLSLLKMSAHAGTHLDSPAHFLAGGRTIDAFPAEDFFLPALVAGIEDREAIRLREIQNLPIREGDAVLFKTRNSRSGLCASGVFSPDYVYLTPEASRFCASRKVRLVGIDYITIERYGDQDYPVHRTLAGSGILILEGIRLDRVPEGRYTLVCLPLRIRGCEASPVRAVLLSDGGEETLPP